MIDRMLECEPHDYIVTLKGVTSGDSIAGDSSEPGGFPAVLLLEGLSQSAALLFRLSYDVPAGELPLLGFLKASLAEQGAHPGDAITFTVRSVKMTRKGGVFEGQARIDGGEVIAEAELAFAAAGGGPLT